MYATNFMFDNHMLSDFGFIICEFDGSDSIEEVQAGTPLTFTTVARNKGRKFSIVDMKYDTNLEATFDICKNPCDYDGDAMYILDDEYLDICRWLVRDEFIETNFFDESDHEAGHKTNRYYNCVFNITKLLYGDRLAGLRISVLTDAPYAHGDKVTTTLSFSGDDTQTLTDKSYLIGTIRPKLTITCGDDGTLQITNSTFSSSLFINNCTKGEIITMDGENQIITSSVAAHDFYNDFNYEFLRIGNTSNSHSNSITSTKACTIKFEYYPIILDTI